MEATQLTAFDSSFLALDSPVSVGHVTLLALLDRDVEPADLRRQIEARLFLAPILRRRLRQAALRLGRPWWIDDPDFDLDRHVCTVDLGGSGSEAAMCGEAVRFAAAQLDRDRPLWQLLLVRGLVGGRSALVSKIHHCAVDGVGWRDLLTLLFGTEEPAAPVTWRASAGPGEITRLTHRVVETGEKVLAALRVEARLLGAAPAAVLRATRATAERLADGLEHLVEHPDTRPARPDHRVVGAPPPTPFNAAITARRSWAYAQLSVRSSKPVRVATGSTVNDILMASTAGALRGWLAENDALPPTPLVVMVPMSVRGSGAAEGGNQLALTLSPMPTHLPTARERLAFCHAAMTHAKDSPTFPSSLLTDVATLAGPTFTQLLTQSAAFLHLADWVHLPFNLMVSNVPAPQQRFRVGGTAQVLGTFPFPPLSDGLGLSVCSQGYDGQLNVGVSSCPDLVPDPARIRDLLVAAHDELLTLAG